MKPGLILFDIDGTLLLSGRAGLRAMTRAFDQTFGITNAFAGESFGGRTDSYLVSKALQAAGIADTPAEHDRFRANYLPLLAEEILHPGTGHKGLMPGTRELLEALADHEHLHLALLTGNYREAAEIKLQHFELWDYFEWGAFSDDAADRNLLVPIALQRAETYDVPAEAIRRAIVIGDTPHDIECARVAGARSIAVATGGFTLDQLREAGADEVLQDLADTEAVIALLL
ncbi:MAG TPA: HAD family hydrolase [Vicinamibacterales bacterium]|jgi:phosphoglycolate phosphatase-like HAD superfamily hydrolase